MYNTCRPIYPVFDLCACALQVSATGRSVCRRVSCPTHQYQPVLICQTADLQVPGTFRDWPRMDAFFWTTGKYKPGIGGPWPASTRSRGPRPPNFERVGRYAFGRTWNLFIDLDYRDCKTENFKKWWFILFTDYTSELEFFSRSFCVIVH